MAEKKNLPRKKKRLGRRTSLSGEKYSGTLAEPIPFKSLQSLSPAPIGKLDPANEPVFELKLFQMRQKKFAALFAFYKVDQNSAHAWETLAYRLACAHVPGFQPARPSGAPQKELGALTVCRHVFIYLRDKPGKKISDACRTLTKPEAALHGISADRVRRIYAARDPEWIKVLEASAARHGSKR